MAALEDRAGADGEIQLAGIATVVATFPHGDALSLFALRTPDALRPQPRFKILPRLLTIRKHLKELNQANREVIVHRGSLAAFC